VAAGRDDGRPNDRPTRSLSTTDAAVMDSVIQRFYTSRLSSPVSSVHYDSAALVLLACFQTYITAPAAADAAAAAAAVVPR